MPTSSEARALPDQRRNLYVYREQRDGRELGARGEARACAGTGGPLCRPEPQGNWPPHKGTGLPFPSFRSLAITVVTVADTVSQGYSHSVLWGAAWVCPEAALAELGDNPVHSDQGQG